MKFSSSFFIKSNSVNQIKLLLCEEDFDFKGKKIFLEIGSPSQELVEVTVSADSFIEFKIGVNALMKSIEIIEKTNLL